MLTAATLLAQHNCLIRLANMIMTFSSGSWYHTENVLYILSIFRQINIIYMYMYNWCVFLLSCSMPTVSGVDVLHHMHQVWLPYVTGLICCSCGRCMVWLIDLLLLLSQIMLKGHCEKKCIVLLYYYYIIFILTI